MIANVLLDLDGTLTDPKEGITRCIQFSLGRLGRETPSSDDLIWCIGPPLKESFSCLLRSSNDLLLNEALGYYRERYSEIGIYENSVYEDIFSSLQRIHSSGFKLILATSKPVVFANRVLDHFELTQFFHSVFGSELSGRLSDKGDLIAHIIKTEKLEPKQTIIMGDRSHDVSGGKKNDIMTAAVTYGYGTGDEIKASEPDFTFHSLSDVAAFLETKTLRSF